MVCTTFYSFLRQNFEHDRRRFRRSSRPNRVHAPSLNHNKGLGDPIPQPETPLSSHSEVAVEIPVRSMAARNLGSEPTERRKGTRTGDQRQIIYFIVEWSVKWCQVRHV
mmetsp:Transcript_13523/g.27647  ORF Transcript_13523/g.27647 Transcript_13523/m.27647 type:complete len:109 (-) Transcript_13523:693-1019(-)